MGTTGGGRGTNQYRVRGTSQTTSHQTTPIIPARAGDLTHTTPPTRFYPTVSEVHQTDPDTLTSTITSWAGDENITFQRCNGQVVMSTPDTGLAFPVANPDTYGAWGPQWVYRFFDTDLDTHA